MRRNEDLVRAFKETIIIANSDRLAAETKRAVDETVVYKENLHARKYSRRLFEAEIIVEENTTFAAAKKYKRGAKRVAVLNFANSINPGGGVINGAIAQEECLCRSSNLYPCLISKTCQEDYYKYNKELRTYFSSNRIIYSKDVIVFKDDELYPKLMNPRDWFKVDVITCAAPYLRNCKDINRMELKSVLKTRIGNIMESAILNDVDVLILGAFGCGAFKNPPDIVADAFYEVIQDDYLYYFNKIVFAIKSSVRNDLYNTCPNIAAFKDRFFGLSYNEIELKNRF